MATKKKSSKTIEVVLDRSVSGDGIVELKSTTNVPEASIVIPPPRPIEVLLTQKAIHMVEVLSSLKNQNKAEVIEEALLDLIKKTPLGTYHLAQKESQSKIK